MHLYGILLLIIYKISKTAIYPNLSLNNNHKRDILKDCLDRSFIRRWITFAYVIVQEPF